MTPHPAVRHVRRAATVLVAVVGVAGCRDASQDPLAVVLTEETHPALGLREGAPSLPDLAAQAGVEPEVTRALDLWVGSWEHPVEEGRALRSEAYRQSAGPLARGLGHAGVSEVLAEVGEALQAASLLPPASLSGELVRELDRARELHGRSREALEAGAPDQAVARALAAADALREVGPHSVAQGLVAQAEARLDEAFGREDAPDSETLDRASRMLHGARLALEEEDWTRALQRAYYACQLLGVEPL